jgi:hypothetical protein
MAAQGITSIQFVDYDSAVYYGHPDSSFCGSNGWCIDTSRAKHDQYLFGKRGWEVTVYDLTQDTVWSYETRRRTYQLVPSVRCAFEILVQDALGSYLKGPIRFIGNESIQGRLCNIFEDSTGFREWIWIEHSLPIQRRQDRPHVAFVQKRDIVINRAFTDSVFLLPP